MSDIDNKIYFKRDLSKGVLEVEQKLVGLKSHDTGLLIVNFRAPEEDMQNIKEFFLSLQTSEPVMVDIGGTGDINCYYKGISPIIKNKDNAGFEYFFVSVTLQELIKKVPVMDDDLHCGAHTCGLDL